MGSIETVTVLFTDLVGSTGLASRIGPAAADELGREHFEILREAIEESGGREVKNLGDGLMVVFSSASSAASCAVGMQQRIERRNRGAPEQLGVRIGLSMGDATLEGDDYFGTPVIEAARLCAKAGGGQILAKEVVRAMAGGREGHSFAPVGDLTLKGLPEPVAAIEVRWEALGPEAAAVPVPPRLQEVPPIAYVGRVSERDQLEQLWTEVAGGRRRLVLISGEPGIGKTRLATHTALEVHASGATVVYGRCEEDLGVPYGPWVEALRHYVEHAPDAVLQAHVARHGGELTRLVGALNRRVAGVPPVRETDPDAERYLLWGAVAGLLAEASTEAPLLLILDDLHWADTPTLALLKHVAGQGAGTRLLILGTYRESDLGRGHPLADLLADLRREQGVERIALGGLDVPDVLAIMEAAAGHEMDERGRALGQQILEETDGNPFYVAELLRHLSESGAIYQQDDGRWVLRGSLEELGLPASVREVVGRRVERLGGPAVRALSTAAVIGRDFDVELLRRVTDHSEDELLDLLDEAVEASVLVESAEVTGRFSFAHALINHTLYEGLGRTRRARFHHRIAEALEEMCAGDPGARLGELAFHWSHATQAVDLPKAVDYARRAGERALDELAPDEALRWFTQAVELHGQSPGSDGVERCDLLIGLGEAQRQVGDPAFRETLLEAGNLADGSGDADRMARAALANNRGYVSSFGEIDQDRLAALERAVVLDRLTNPARSARLLSLQALELQFDPDHERRRALADEALALAREAGDARTLAYVLRDHFNACWAPDTVEQRLETARELVDVAAAVDDPVIQAWAMALTMHVDVEGGNMRGAEEAADRFHTLADELGEPTLRFFADVHDFGLAFLHGDLVEAERLMESAAEVGGEAGQSDTLFVYGAQVSAIRSWQDRNDEIVEILEQGVEDNPLVPAFVAGLANVYCLSGRTDEARPLLEAAAAQGFAHVPHDQARSSTLAYFAASAAEVGARDAAATLYELLEPARDQIVWSGIVTYGRVLTFLGLLAATLGWDERADDHFRAACKLEERDGLLLPLAHARVAWAEALAQRGEAGRAHDEAGRAFALARGNGYGTIERRASAVLDAPVRAG